MLVIFLSIQAITSYTQTLFSHQDDSVLVNRGIVHSILRDTKLALADFDLAIELNPHSAPSYFNRGNLHYSLGDYSSAEQDYKKGLIIAVVNRIQCMIQFNAIN